MRKHIFGIVTPVLGLLFSLTIPVLSAPAPTKNESPLTAIPAKAPIVVQVRGYEQAKQHLGGFLSNSLPDLAPKIVKTIDDGIKELLEGRETKAFSKDGHIFLAITDLEGITEHPQGALLLPVSDYAAFRDTFLTEKERKTVKKETDGYYSVKLEKLDDPVYLVDRKSTVVLTKEKDIAKMFAGSDYATLDKSMAVGTAKAFLGTDVAVYVNLKIINDKYGTQIKGIKTLLDIGLQGAQGQGIDKKQAEVIKQIVGEALQLLEDGQAFVLGLEFREEGANLKMQVQFGEKTETNDFLKKFTPAPLSQLATLPTGQLAFSATNFDLSNSKMFSKIVYDMIADDEDDDAKKAIREAIEELAKQRSIIQLSASNLFKGGLEVQEFADAKKVVNAHLNLMKALTKTSSFGTTPLKEKPVIKENAETVGNFKLTSVVLTFDIEKAVEALPEAAKEAAKASLTKMLGDGLKIWFGSDGKKYVQVTAKDFSEAKSLLEEYIDGKKILGKDEGFLATRKQLPTDATFLMVGDTCRVLQALLDLVKDQAQAIPGLPGGGIIPNLKAPKGKPAYFGIAATLKPEYGTIDLFVPTSAVQQVRKMFASVLESN